MVELVASERLLCEPRKILDDKRMLVKGASVEPCVSLQVSSTSDYASRQP